jgi:Cu/Ag efflux protein CusF
MKKTIAVIVAVLISISFIAAGLAQEKPAEVNKPRAEEKRKTSIYAGIVGKVDTKSKTVEVIKENSELGLSFDVSEAKFEGYKSIKSIKRGDKVKVEYDVKRGKMIAIIIKKINF